jgi:ABC-2 type transport system ATP-binding protein
MSAPSVELRDVTLRRSAQFTLAVPYLTLRPGITVVRGPNGGGKTSLLRLVATVLEPTTGTVRIGGIATNDDAGLVAIRRQLGYLPQDDSVPPRMRVFDHVDVLAVMREIASTSRQRRALVATALDQVDLLDYSTVRVHTLSGGQRRRVALAAALMGNPSLLVLDEPDAFLDDVQRDRITQRLRAMAATTTIVMSTHDHAWADQLSDSVVVAVGGRVE